MSKTLVIVESPGKIKKIQSYLGNGYLVKASVGHIMDLPSDKMSIDILLQDNGSHIFVPKYIPLKDKASVIATLKNNVKNCTDVLIASDEDREGEFIAYSLQKLLDLNNPKRIVFNAITKNEIIHAVNNPKTIDTNLVHAQQSRRLLDRLVGYSVSPLLGNKLSAGRVQSVVVKLIIEKENEIKSQLENLKTHFVVHGNFGKIEAKLISFPEKEINKEVLLSIKKVSPYIVDSVESKQTERSPPAPFITSTLQQEASSRLKFSPAVTMQVAQKLYEKGYITYMRTDSCSISKGISDEISNYIKTTFTDKYYTFRTFKNKVNSQEAHECIRPTQIKTDFIDEDNNENKLYQLIWKRTIASQMVNAIYDNQIITIKKESYIFKTTNKKLNFDGFLKVYHDTDKEDDATFIDIKKGELLELKVLKAKEEFNYHNSRYTEASLIKKLEDLSIGRPSTFVSILNTIQKRTYVVIGNAQGVEKEILEITIDTTYNEKKKKVIVGADKKKFIPTETGIQVNNFLEQHFSNIFNYSFTAELENKLDLIAEGKLHYQSVLNDTYSLLLPKLNSKSNYSSNPNVISLGTDQEGSTYTVMSTKFGWTIKKDYSNVKDSLFVGIGEDIKDTITLDSAIEKFTDTKLLGIYRNKGVYLIKGKFGPYIKYNKKNISLRGNENPTFEAVKKLL
jgi:DNA topoisomerase-1